VKTIDGREVEIVAASEKLLHIGANRSRESLIPRHRHVPVQIGGVVRIAEDQVLEELARKLGAASRTLKRRRPSRRVTVACTAASTITDEPRTTATAREPALPVGAYSYSQGLEARGSRHRRDARAPKRGSPMSWSSASRASGAGAAPARSTGRLRRAMTSSSRRARRRSCAPRPCRWGTRSPSCSRSSASTCRSSSRFPTTYAAACARGASSRTMRSRGILVVAREPGAGGVRPCRSADRGAEMLLTLGERLAPIGSAGREAQWVEFAPGLAFLSAGHETPVLAPFRS